MLAPRSLVLAAVHLALLAAVVEGQSADVEYFAYVGPEWVVLPELERQGDVWSEVSRLVGEASPSGWERPARYFYRDGLTGERIDLRSDSVVHICCDNIGNDVWALSTDRTPAGLPGYVWKGAGYALSTSQSDAPFLPLQVDVTPASIAEVLDSMSSLPDSLPARLETVVWQARLEEETHTFFQVTESAIPAGCFIAVGWLVGGLSGEAVPVSGGWDDCEGKGHAERRPWALLRRGGDLLMIIEFGGWDGGPTKVWRHLDGSEWEVLFDPWDPTAAGSRVGSTPS